MKKGRIKKGRIKKNDEQRKVKMRDNEQGKEKDITDLIGDIKKSYHKSNLSDISIDSLSNAETPKRIGYMLTNSINLSNKDYSINFDPIESHFLKKFVSEETMQKRIVLRAEDYFKGIIFIDYFTSVITKNSGFIDELYEIAKEFERINPLLDPDMDILTKYVGVSYISLMGKEYIMSRSSPDNSEKRFQKNNNPFDDSYIGVKRLDPFYETLGQKVYSMLNSPEVIKSSSGFKGLNDLRAIIFVDCLMPYIENQDSKKAISDLLDSGKYYNASVSAINIFSKEASLKSMEEYMKTVAQKSQELDLDSI